MKTIVRSVVAVVVAFMLSVPLVAQQPVPRSNFQGNRAEKAERNERHPEIRNAIRALERAKDDLQKANHDFGGHRADALKACDEAIRQLQLALQYDKK